MLAVSIPNFETSAAFVETATKCFATDFSSPPRPASDQARADWAFVIVSSVVKVFEETMNNVSARIQIPNGFGEIRAVNIGNKTEGHRSVAVVPKRFVGHHRAKVGASDSDIDDVANALAGVALPFSAAHTI